MASPEAEKFAELLRSAPPMAELPLAEQRAAGEHAEDMTTIPAGVAYTAVEDRVRPDLAADAPVPPEGVDYTAAHPVRGLWAVPPAARADRALLYLFGGGHVITSVAARRRFAGHLALAAGVRVLALDYPLAPEHPFPADVNAAVDGYDWLLEQRFPATGIALAGESSGGGLVLSTLLELHRRGLPQPAGAYLMSPWADLTCSGTSFDTRADVDLECSRSSLLRMAGQYLAGHDPADVVASPALCGAAGLATACPPLLVQVGGDEVLLDDSVTVARSAGMGGTRVRLEIWPEMQHFFQLGVGLYPEAQEALDAAGDWIARRLEAART